MTPASARVDAVAVRLFADVMAPLVLGGAVRPGHAIGARVALSFGPGREPPDADLAARVGAARVRRARRLAPVDDLPGPSANDWALAAIFHDLLQAANPAFDAPLRRSAARLILDLAMAALERVPAPANVGAALATHTWVARAVDATRTDTTVRWWSGAREYLGVEPPERLQAWPRVRRVSVARTPRRLLEMAPLAVERDALAAAVTAWLARSPLTDLATCTRPSPPFAWQGATVALLATGPGRALASRALARLAPGDVDGALGEPTRALFAALARPNGRDDLRRAGASVMELLGERALGAAAAPDAPEAPTPPAFAAVLGAVAARRELDARAGHWSEAQRRRLRARLSMLADSPLGRDAQRLADAAMPAGALREGAPPRGHIAG